MAEALEVKKRAEARLFAIPGVHTVGFGGKVTAGKPIGEFAILVYLSAKKPEADVPPNERIPAEIDGVKTDVIESTGFAVPYAPLQGGTLIRAIHDLGGAAASEDGTLGCLARLVAADTAPPDVLLTCRHLLYQEDDSGTVGDQVVLPGCCCDDLVAKVLAGPGITLDLDAALAKIEPGIDSKAQIHNVPVKGTLDLLDPALPAAVKAALATHTYRVYQYGEKSGFTRGVVVDLDTTASNGTVRVHSGQIAIKPIDKDYFTQKGDSGSVVYNDDNQIVGLHWGGIREPAPPPRNSSANHIAKVLAAFPGLRIAKNPPEVIYRTPGVRKLPPALARLHRDLIAYGCIDYYVGLYGRHLDETRELFERNRLLIYAWHKNHGPRMGRAIFDLMEDRIRQLPEEIEERSWKSCVQAIGEALLTVGSERLRADVSRYLSFTAALGGRSYEESLQLMRSLAMVTN